MNEKLLKKLKTDETEIKRDTENRCFTDFNNKLVKIEHTTKLKTQFKKTKRNLKWWIVKHDCKPIIGTDNMEKLHLFVAYQPKHNYWNTGIPEHNRDTETQPKHNYSTDQVTGTDRLTEINRVTGITETSKLTEILKNKFYSLFNTNTRVHNFEYNVKMKPNYKAVQQKGRIVPIHLQDLVKEELDKLIAEGHVVRETQVGEDQFISPVVITRKDNGTVKMRWMQPFMQPS